MPLQGPFEEALGRRQITAFAEKELNGVPDAVDGTIQIHPLTADLDIGLIDVPFAGNGAFAPIEALKQLWREVDDQRCTVEWSTLKPRSAIISSRSRRLRL
jgi:hypothetical protein